MSQEKSPAFQFYPKDFLTDRHVVAMTHTECGVYIRLLCLCWLERSLPAELDALARLCHVSLATFTRLWPALAPCFTVVEGRLIQHRIERERMKQDTWRALKTEAGRKGGNAKAAAKQKASRRLAQPLAKASPPSSSSSSSSVYDLHGPAMPAGEANDEETPINAQLSQFIARFCELYRDHRHGARYFIKREKHVPLLRALLKTYDSSRLEKLAVILLTTDDAWVSDTDRGIGILSTKASWLEGLLADYEAQHGPIAVTA